MPEFHAPLTKIDRAETRRYAGLRGETAFPDSLLEQACDEALLLARPKGCWQNYRYDAASGGVDSQPPVRLDSASIRGHLSAAVEIAVLAVTIGPALEEAVSAHFAAGKYTLGLLLDAAGSAAVESTADALNALIADQAARRGLGSLFRFSPGYGDWEITDQPQVLSLSGGAAIGVGVTPSCMLLPRKSVTAVVGHFDAKNKPAGAGCGAHGCSGCSQANCPARKEPQR